MKITKCKTVPPSSVASIWFENWGSWVQVKNWRGNGDCES